MAPDFLPINPPSVRSGVPQETAPEGGGSEDQRQGNVGHTTDNEADDSPEASGNEEVNDGEEEPDDNGELGDDELSDIDETLPQPTASRKSLREDPLQRSKTSGRKRRRRVNNSSSASQEEMPEFPIQQETEPDVVNPAAHISVRELPHSLIYGDLTGPSKGWLGLPVGLFTKDPFKFPGD